MRMPRRAALVVVACLLVSLSLLAMPLTAQAAVYPCLFYGRAAVDGVAVDAEMEISAWVEGELVASTTTGTGTLDSDQYCLAIEIEAPAEVTFKIGELWAVETATWVRYGEVEVDLTATSGPITVISLAVVGDPLTEENLGGSVITVTLAEDTYETEIAATDFDPTTAPVGTTVASVVRTSDTVATLTLAFDGTDFDVDAELVVTVAAMILVISTEAVVSENTLPITATEESAPVASFDMSETVAVVGVDVVFTCTSLFIDSWEWDFDGDETVDSFLENPTYDYTEQGVYFVTLKVTNALGDSTTDPVQIIVVPAIAGAKGDTGDAGAKGDTGDAGAKGDTGDAGAKGDTGDAGADGTVGAAGAPGAAGAQGEQGVAGAPGSAGAQGEQGVPGTTGATGESGEGASKTLPILALVFAIVALLGAGITILRTRKA